MKSLHRPSQIPIGLPESWRKSAASSTDFNGISLALSARRNKLKMAQRNKLIVVKRNKLKTAQREKLTQGRR
jgi:hypothetical protein